MRGLFCKTLVALGNHESGAEAHPRRSFAMSETTVDPSAAAGVTPDAAAVGTPEATAEAPAATPPLTIRSLLEAGIHFGHQTRRWNPKSITRTPRLIFPTPTRSSSIPCWPPVEALSKWSDFSRNRALRAFTLIIFLSFFIFL